MATKLTKAKAAKRSSKGGRARPAAAPAKRPGPARAKPAAPASKAPKAAPNPSLIWDTMWAYGRTSLLHAAVVHGLFDALVSGKKTAAEVAAERRCDARATRMVLDGLVGLALLTKSGDRYDLTPDARKFLVSDESSYLGGLIGHIYELSQPWGSLPDVLRTGQPIQPVDAETTAREFFPKLVRALFPPSFGASTAAREALPPKMRNKVRRILDVACGSAAWSLAWAAADPEVRVTAHDFGEILGVAHEHVGRMGATDRYDYLEGNLRAVDFGENRYDLVILGQICHSEGPRLTPPLIAKCARALKPGGLLLIGDIVPNETRTGSLRALLFGVNMLIRTTEGDVFTLGEYRRWMTDAGLGSIRKLDLGPDGPDIIVGTKPE